MLADRICRRPSCQMPRSISSKLCWAATALACSLTASGWEIKTFGGHEHVPIEEVATFYGMGHSSAPDANTKKLCGSGRELVATRSCREVGINGIKHWLAFPVVEEGGRFYVSRLDLGKTIEPAFRPAQIQGIPPVTTVVLDPGHGGNDNGARSRYEYEKNFSLDVARRVRDRLKKSGLRVLMTRNRCLHRARGPRGSRKPAERRPLRKHPLQRGRLEPVGQRI